MPTSRQQSTGASNASATTKKFAEKEELQKERAIKRAERAEARRVKAEEHKGAGNAHFRKGEYREAIAEWEVAIKVNGPTAKCLSNMAAAWLKLEKYDAAEQCASRALCFDPKFTKARFRRGQARRGNLQLALAHFDFATIFLENLETKQDSTEVIKALTEIVILLKERNEEIEDTPIALKDSVPKPNDGKTELESVSDSSDWNHIGNGSPCPNYNHDGCTRGVNCELSHGPDYKSVRDRLGRNVCVKFLLDDCRGICVYSHDKTHLPSGRWWESEDKRAKVRDMYSWDIFRQKPASTSSLPKLLSIIDSRFAWTPKHTAKVEEAHVWRDHIMMLEGFGEDKDDLPYATWVSTGKHGPRPVCPFHRGRCSRCSSLGEEWANMGDLLKTRSI